MKQILLTLLGALMGAFFLPVEAQVVSEIAHRVEFVKKSFGSVVVKERIEHYSSYGAVTLPGQPQAAAGQHIYSMGKSHRPPGATTMWLSFRFLSDGYFSVEPRQHFAVVVRGEATSNFVSGRGFLVGDMREYGAGCPPGTTLQPETWMRPTAENGGAHHYIWPTPDVCSTQLQDRRWYYVTVHVSADWVSLWVCDEYGRPIYNRGFWDQHNTDNALIRNVLSGYVIGVLSDDQPSNWRVIFDNLQHGWF